MHVKKTSAPTWKYIYKTILVRANKKKYNLYITNGEMPNYLSMWKDSSKEWR